MSPRWVVRRSRHERGRNENAHHTCTTTEGQTRSTTATQGHFETPCDLGKHTNVLISDVRRFTFAT